MNIVLWMLQVLLGVAFCMAGFTKVSTPLPELTEMGMKFVAEVPGWLVRFIGVSEVLGGLGLVLPAAARIKPQLTPIAAALLCVVMVLAVGSHLFITDDPAGIVPSLVLGLLSAVVAWGRFKKAPITPR